jgi:hypothetical protein
MGFISLAFKFFLNFQLSKWILVEDLDGAERCEENHNY